MNCRVQKACALSLSQGGLRLQTLQSRVLPLLAQCPVSLLDLLLSIYQLHAADRHLLLDYVSHLYHKGKFKEVSPATAVPTV